MIPWVLVYTEDYERFLEKKSISSSEESFKRFLSEIGTQSLMFQKPNKPDESAPFYYKEVPEGSCIYLRTSHGYEAVLHQKLFSASHEKQDKSRRGSSCSIV